MLRKLTQYAVLSLTLLISAGNTFADQQGYYYDSENFHLLTAKPQDDLYDFSRSGKAYYVYAGYVYSYHFNDKNTIGASGPLPIFEAAVKPSSDLPDQFHSVEVGVGKEWGKYLDIQIAYMQQFENQKTSTVSIFPGSTGVSSVGKKSAKGLMINFLGIFNPEDQFQVGGEIGISVMSISDYILAGGITYRLPDDDTVEIDPTFGMEFIMQLTHGLAMRLRGQYIWHTDSKISSGEINALAGFSYTL